MCDRPIKSKVANGHINVEDRIRVKSNAKPIGGMQVILPDDLYQLPSVLTPEFGDDGSSILSSSILDYFHHLSIQLTYRQDKSDLTTLLLNLCQ
ncbi:hypothetical protein CHS0354_003832 [Potamilus streckersoni]|uniref:Uncharacterized protein n=1 Tax=Potamilus streckersoni TaxID=2493646 RepID=A0AAE0SGU3_9BIVA|nr:hypothetical protein CHS0354_003832 [Potamilus streckersoni]